jgi:hypothetical protein
MDGMSCVRSGNKHIQLFEEPCTLYEYGFFAKKAITTI